MVHLHPLYTPRAHSFVHQRFLWCIGGSNSPWSEFICRHGSCLLTKRGSKEHRPRPKQTKISNMSSCRPRVFQIALFMGFPNIPHIPPPTGHTLGTNDTTMTTSTENLPSWCNPHCPQEIFKIDLSDRQRAVHEERQEDVIVAHCFFASGTLALPEGDVFWCRGAGDGGGGGLSYMLLWRWLPSPLQMAKAGFLRPRHPAGPSLSASQGCRGIPSQSPARPLSYPRFGIYGLATGPM